ncbi:MAG: hypothetical protein KC505_03265 [Myxococcales bacterium]|nr:hypothetical protein [Myxococcales bacterium]USN51824.1 MAG: hypothetical protein H6731_05305 [Myxococcales bacterium]
MKKEVFVQKFGGSSVASPEKISLVAEYIKQSLTKQKQICVVVSAMGHTTNELIKLAHHINPHPPKREMDMLISCGERSSMALLAMALAKIGVKAISLTGSQSGIITDDHHSNAEIIAIRPQRIIEAFSLYDVVIVAGFQGVSSNKEITTLKRGGSDTTAVALTAALEAQLCEIYTDVPGVMDCDPKILPFTQPINELDHKQMSSMALYGAKVLAHDAAQIAQQLNVSILIAQSGTRHGTHVKEKIIRNKSSAISAINHLRGVVHLNLPLEQICFEWHNYFLFGQIKDGFISAYVSNDIAQELLKDASTSSGLALITLQLAHRTNLGQTILYLNNILRERNIALIESMIGCDEIFVVIRDEALENALTHLHAAFLLEGT